MSGNEYADWLLEQILAQGAQIEIETVCSVEDRADRKAVLTEEGSCFEGLTVVLANGVRHRTLGLPGEEDLVGEGISYCAVCDGDFYAGRRVCVAGGGTSALQEALLLADKCASVTVLQDLEACTGEQRLQEVLFRRPNVQLMTGVRITGLLQAAGALNGVRVSAGGEEQVIPCEGLFVAIGLVPQNEAFAGVAALNAYGYYDADERCLTRTPGVFVAGDCRNKTVRQLTTAVADGACAAIAACRWINRL